MHPDILSQPTRVPQDFGDETLKTRAAEFRSKTKCSRLPAHIRAFIVRDDPKASASERAAASEMIQTLVTYCDKHWRLYVDTIVKKTRKHGFPLQCLSCGEQTRWQASSGLRVGILDGQDHQYCKQLTAGFSLPSTRKMLALPTINEIWSKVRKNYDASDTSTFQQRAEAKQLASDLGYVSAVTSADIRQTPQPVCSISSGWHCFACAKSEITQPFIRVKCEWCGTPFTNNVNTTR